jgi:hypothetical protein
MKNPSRIHFQLVGLAHPPSKGQFLLLGVVYNKIWQAYPEQKKQLMVSKAGNLLIKKYL